MKDKNDLEIHLGDSVIIENNERAVVVFVAALDDEDPAYLKEHWKEIVDGVLVKTELGALVQYHDCHSGDIVKG